MENNGPLTASQEDYLEAIYLICEKKRAAKAKDIAKYLSVRASSVTTALRMLSSRGLVNYSPYDLITMTPEGQQLGQDIVRRHRALSRFFTSVLGINEDTADQAACKMEHSVPREIVDRLIQYADYVQHCPRGEVTWDAGSGYFCSQCSPEDCQHNDDQGGCSKIPPK